MANPPGTRIDIAVCPKHGLRYNRATDSGCAFCRRDAGRSTDHSAGAVTASGVLRGAAPSHDAIAAAI